MSVQQQFNQEKDSALWDLAKKRAGFKIHARVYLLVNVFLWGLWLLQGNDFGNHRAWPLMTTIGWGIGLAFHFANAYLFPKFNSVEREYEKLKNKQV